MKKHYTFFIILLLSLEVVAQSPWVKSKNKGFAQLGFTSISNYKSLYVDGDKKLDLPRKVSDMTVQLFAEHGLTDKYTLQVAVPLKLMSTGDLTDLGLAINEKGNLTALGNPELTIRREIWKKGKWIVGAFGTMRVGIQIFDEKTGLRSGLDSWGFQPGASLGYGSSRFYGYAFAGYEFRTNGYSGAFRVGNEIGYKLYKQIYIAHYTEMVSSSKDGDVKSPLENFATGTYVDQQEYFAGTLKLIVGINDKIGATLSSTSFNLMGNYVARQVAFSVGVYMKW